MKQATNLALTFLVASITACDPCGTTLSCEQAPRVAVVGQILEEQSGAPVAGASIEMRRVSGVDFLQPVRATTTRDNGTFEIEMETVSLGDAVVSIRVASPGAAPYDVLAVPTRATVLTGEATILKPWSSGRPRLTYVIELFRDGTADDRLANAEVEFRRTGGVHMFIGGAEVASTIATANEVGWVFPFRDVTTDAAGDLVGDFTVRYPPQGAPVVIRGLSFPALPLFAPQLSLVRLPVPSS